MQVQQFIHNAEGTLWESVLTGRMDGYVPPGVVEWAPGQGIMEYLSEAEQPHFFGVGEEFPVKVSTFDPNLDLRAIARFPLKDVQKRPTYDEWVGYQFPDDPYPNLLVVTNKRLLFIIGKKGQNIVASFPYDGSHVESIDVDGAITADGLQYNLGVQVRERQRALQYIDKKTPLAVKGLNSYRSNESARSLSEESHRDLKLEDLMGLSPRGFEEYVADVWDAQGYSCSLTKQSGDGGIDVIAEKDGERTLIQAKRYTQQKVSIGTVQRAAGLLADSRHEAVEALVVTTAVFSIDARSWARRSSNIKLVDGNRLVELGNRLQIPLCR